MNFKVILYITTSLLLALLLSACGSKLANDVKSIDIPVSKTIPATPGFQTIDTNVGTGAVVEAGQTVSVHYTGWLFDANLPENKGKKFDSSFDRGQPFHFPLGDGKVIKGWDQGFVGMKVGGKRTLIIPSDLAYGERGAGSSIPPGATLLFEVELLGIK